MTNFWLKVKPVHENAKEPTKGSFHSAGFDLYVPQGGFIDPLQRSLIPLGITTAFAAGWAGLILDRSGMGNKGITRFAGVVDSDYRGEWKVILYNSNPQIFKYEAGDRIAQVVFVPHGIPDGGLLWNVDLDETVRGEGGLGSTGK